MSIQRLLTTSILLFSPLAFAADPPPRPADNPQVQQPPPRQQPQQQPQPNQPQRQFNRGFGFGFGQRRPDVFAETLAALGDLALSPDFVITPEQKESIQSLRSDQKLAMDKWRGDNHDEIQKMAEELQAARESGNQEKSRELFQKQQAFFQKGPRPEDAVKKLTALLNEEQRKRLDEKLAERRAEAEVQRQQTGFLR
ncbi:MAG TPA: hypothetical protein VGP99_01600 [Tepidisphaeraceae bacterium]|jgi:hypothetical protein|nr:hypothetical protein [Tepidisphaeraceae bacterium]